MLVRLASRNVRRSARDYAIYFITVALGVAMFYAFNTIKSQAVLLDALSTDSMRMLNLLDLFMGLFSGVVTCVLGFLVVYANRFLIRRRRREFGTYLLLGMGAGRVSLVLLAETLVVGLASLVVGLALGIALSQGLSFATAALMGATMTRYQFIVSGKAAVLTTLCFLGIFVVSGLIDVIYVRRCKLATLLSAHEANEGTRPINAAVRAVAFLASIGILACAYWQLSLNGLTGPDVHFVAATALMLVGTFLFFWSAAGFVVAALQHARGLYLRGITMFTVRQISSKIGTAFASIAVVCVMLFFALTTTSAGMGMVDLFVGNLERSTAYDATICAQPWLLDEGQEYDDGTIAAEFDAYDGDMAACLSDRALGWDNLVSASAQVDYYQTDATYAALLDQVPGSEGMVDDSVYQAISDTNVSVISQSQFNAAAALVGGEKVDLSEGECAVNNTVSGYERLADAFCANGIILMIAGNELHFSGKPLFQPMRTGALMDVSLEVIVPDGIVERLRIGGTHPSVSVLDVMYTCDRADGDRALNVALQQAQPYPEGVAGDSETSIDFNRQAWPAWTAYTGKGMTDQAMGFRMVVTYLALYIGFVLLVATAAILAIQQLSETADSLPRYARLSTLGCERNTIMGSLRTQTVVYFLAPLVLAVCHSACAVSVLNSTFYSQIGVGVSRSLLLSFGPMVIIYAIYLTATYLLSRSIVKSSLSRS